MKTLGDWEWYATPNGNVYEVFQAPFGAGTWTRGKDYLQSAVFDEKMVTPHVVFEWNWPHELKAGVRSFNKIAYGNHDNDVIKATIPARKVGGIKTLSIRPTITMEGFVQGSGVITDIFLSDAPGNTGPGHKRAEIIVNHHVADPQGWLSSRPKVRTMVDPSGRSWLVQKDVADIDIWLITPTDGKDALSGPCDLADMMRFLVYINAIKPDWYFNGFGLGAEVKHGGGKMTLTLPAVEYS